MSKFVCPKCYIISEAEIVINQKLIDANLKHWKEYIIQHNYWTSDISKRPPEVPFMYNESSITCIYCNNIHSFRYNNVHNDTL